MTTDQIKELFARHEAKGLRFEFVENKMARRRDVHAFVLMDKLFPSDECLVSCAEHDQIWFSPREDELSNLTEENIIELTQCGILWDEEFDCLTKFV